MLGWIVAAFLYCAGGYFFFVSMQRDHEMEGAPPIAVLFSISNAILWPIMAIVATFRED